MPNPNGTPENLVAAHPGNESRLVHGLYRARRQLAPRATEIAEALLEAAPHTIPLDRIGAEEIGALIVTMDRIDADRRRGEREGDHGGDGPCVGDDDVRPLRAPDAGRARRGASACRRVPPGDGTCATANYRGRPCAGAIAALDRAAGRAVHLHVSHLVGGGLVHEPRVVVERQDEQRLFAAVRVEENVDVVVARVVPELEREMVDQPVADVLESELRPPGCTEVVVLLQWLPPGLSVFGDPETTPGPGAG
jgi:hypothetical protein